MYCFRCGNKLPPRVVSCPDCDTPQKRRQRYRRRMILGLFIFLAGAVAGSLFDTFFFKGRAWEHSFLGALNSQETASTTVAPAPYGAYRGPTPMNPVDMVGMEPPVTPVTTVQSTPSSLDSVATPAADVEPYQEAPAAAAEEDAVSSQTLPVQEAVASVAVLATESVKPVVAARLVYAGVDVLEKDTSSSYHGSLSRDGSELVFSSNRLKVNGKNTYQCFIKKPAASEKAVRAFDWTGNVWTPEFTPDGSRIVFSSDSIAPEHLFVYDRKAGKAKALTSGESKNMMSAVSPDGRLIAFTSAQKGKPNNIWLIGIEGDNLVQLTSSTADDREPRWSADGSTLYFTRIHTYMKKSDIMRVRLDPLGEAEPVVQNGRRNWLPDISPDGGTLVYVRSESDDGSKNVIVVRRLETGEETVIKPLGETECLRPVWAADASGLVFHATVGSTRNLYFARFKSEQQGN
jgi:dipeptidyl aminopeptidase/acylaminoacyl peptidase